MSKPRLIAILCPPSLRQHARIYRLVDTNEWVVRHIGSTGHEFGSSYHSDKDDAIATAEWEIKRLPTNILITFIGGSVKKQFYAYCYGMYGFYPSERLGIV